MNGIQEMIQRDLKRRPGDPASQQLLCSAQADAFWATRFSKETGVLGMNPQPLRINVSLPNFRCATASGSVPMSFHHGRWQSERPLVEPGQQASRSALQTPLPRRFYRPPSELFVHGAGGFHNLHESVRGFKTSPFFGSAPERPQGVKLVPKPQGTRQSKYILN